MKDSKEDRGGSRQLAGVREKKPHAGKEQGKGQSHEKSHRVQRVEREIREVVGSYLISGFKGGLPGLVSLTRVICTKDFRNAKILVTMLSFSNTDATSAVDSTDNSTGSSIGNSNGKAVTGSVGKPSARERMVEREREKAIEVLQAHAFEVQGEINRCLRMKHCPKVTFVYDSSYENVMKVEKILRDISHEKNGKARTQE